MKNYIKALFLLLALLIKPSISKSGEELDVLLYSYIPTGSNQRDFSTLKNRITKDFNKLYPNIKLNLTIDRLKDTYSALSPKEVQKGMSSKNGYDLIEVDSILLPAMIEKGLVEPPNEFNTDKYLKSSLEPFKINGIFYGVPTVMCSYYLFSSKKNILDPLDWKKQEKILSSLGESYTIYLKYLLFFSRNYFSVENAYKKPYSKKVFNDMVELTRRCPNELCTGQSYSKITEISKDLLKYSKKSSIYALGYSQLLHHLHITDKKFNLFPIKTKAPILSMVNGLVLNKNKCSSAKCKKRAAKFSNFFSSFTNLKSIALNLDNPSFPPRYISPAIKKFYNDPDVLEYKNFNVILETLQGSTPLEMKSFRLGRIELTKSFIKFLENIDPKYSKMWKNNLLLGD